VVVTTGGNIVADHSARHAADGRAAEGAIGVALLARLRLSRILVAVRPVLLRRRGLGECRQSQRRNGDENLTSHDWLLSVGGEIKQIQPEQRMKHSNRSVRGRPPGAAATEAAAAPVEQTLEITTVGARGD